MSKRIKCDITKLELKKSHAHNRETKANLAFSQNFNLYCVSKMNLVVQ